MKKEIFKVACFLLLITFLNTSFPQIQIGQDIDGENAGDNSGSSISMPDPYTIGIGAYSNNGNGIVSGHVRVFSWNGSYWLQKGQDIDGEFSYDYSGYSVSMPDANTIAIGAPRNSLNVVSEEGHVRIYSWNGTSWEQKGNDIDGENSGSYSGCSVSMPDVNTVAIGAKYNNGNGAPNSGHVRIYNWNGNSWVQKGLDIDGEDSEDNSGHSVSMPDVNTVAIGANRNDGNGNEAGHVRIYSWNGNSWIQKGIDIDGEAPYDVSGYSVSMPDANTVAIGAISNDGNLSDNGHVRIYTWNGNAWVQKGNDIDGEAPYDVSGYSVSMPDENTVAIGATGNDGNGNGAGHVRIFSWNGSVWVKIGEIDGEGPGDAFGSSISMFDSNTIGISAPGNDGNGNGAGSVRIFRFKGVSGSVFSDLNQNCQIDSEVGLSNFKAIIQPGNLLVEAISNGNWSIDSLPAGNYTITIDTTNTNWTLTCPITQSFTVVHPDSLTIAPSFGMVANNPCPSPNVSVNMPFMRPCFTGQQVHVQACNEYDATGILPDAYSIVELDPNLIFESASLPYTSLGNNQYRFEHDTLYPGQCVNYTISTQLDCNAPLGLTLCLEANLYPVADCVLDTIPTPPTGEVIPCTLPWDQSSLSVEGWCANDSIYFTITNTGQLGGGDMECYSPVRVFVDGVPYLLDSIKLLGGETFTYVFAGNGATWILEADQHPLHPGNSHPNAHVENCNPGSWTPDIVNNFPTDDADPVKDIYCGMVTGSYDPNDKKGSPYGLGAEHEVSPNQDIEYLIRFQNTGTDTAFNIVVRDTLDLDFDIFSVTAGSASHNYSFRMYGPRVLEWTFSNILLPDSTTNEVASHGFLSYRVKQKPNLPDGTLLTNDADIYFDFNAPIITNETSHKVQQRIFEPTNSLVSLSQTKTGIKLYPNPTKQESTLSFSTYQKQVSYKLLNLSGQVILEKSNLYGKEVKVNLPEIPNGIYLMKISTNQGTEILKVVRE